MKGELATAAQIARVLRCSKQNVHKRLWHLPSDGELLHGGNLTKAWKIESLPAAIFDKLNEIKNEYRYGAISDLLRDPPNRDLSQRVSTRRSVSIARERGLDVLESGFEALGDVKTLSVPQKVYLWTKVCDELQLQIEAAARTKKPKSAIREKRIKRAILKVLVSSELFGRAKETIRRNLNRQWKAYCANGGKLKGPRQDRDCRVKLPVEDERKLVARSLDCGGRVRQAFRELRDSGELTAETLARTIDNPSRKSHIPTSIARQLTPEVRRLMPLHHGLREHQLRGAYNTRDYSGLYAGDSYQADDVTCPVYYWEHDAHSRFGFRIIRGQLLMMIDERSRLALGFPLPSENTYNARIIRALVTP